MSKPQIISDPQIFGGKPIIAGTRISVELLLDRLASGMTTQEILNDYPHLNANQIDAAISYAKKAVTQTRPNPKHKSATTLYTHEVSR